MLDERKFLFVLHLALVRLTIIASELYRGDAIFVALLDFDPESFYCIDNS